MAQEMQRVQLTPQTDLADLLEQVHDDKTPRLIEKEGEALAVVSPVEPTPAQSVQAFYVKMTKRPAVRELLSRLAKE
jgi:hypothetical protein